MFTSPTSAIFPGDIFIGTVLKVYPLDPFLTFQSLEIAPAADASSLKEVMILKARAAVPKFLQGEEGRAQTSFNETGDKP